MRKPQPVDRFKRDRKDISYYHPTETTKPGQPNYFIEETARTVQVSNVSTDRYPHLL